MRKADIKAGPVLAYREGRNGGSYWPVVILDTNRLYTTTRVGVQRLAEALPGATPHGWRPGYGSSRVGYLAVQLKFGPDDPEYTGKLGLVHNAASIGAAMLAGENTPVAGAEDYATYKLVTSLSYLHGDYAERVAEVAAAEERDNQLRSHRVEERDGRQRRGEKILERLLNLGTEARLANGDYTARIELSLDQAEEILDRLEKQ